MKRTVKLIAVDNRYKKSNYPYRCIYHDGKATYLTGQHIDPDDSETRDNLTVDEMTAKVQLSEDKKRRFPYVINPLHPIQFYNDMILDLSKNGDGSFKNSKDVAMFELIKNHAWFVAKSRTEVVPKKHYFYLFDAIFEAEQRVSKSDLQYKAEKFIREDNTEAGLRDVALILSYKLKGFEVDVDSVTPLILKDKILEACKTDPDRILECKLPSSKEELFVLKLAYNGIISKRGTDFYNGSEFIGKDLIAVIKYMRLEDKSAVVSKWSRLLMEKEGHVFEKENNDTISKKEELFKELETKSFEELKEYAGSKRYPKIEHIEYTDKDKMLKYLISKVK